MARDTAPSSDGLAPDAVMAAIDTEGGVSQLVIADVTAEGSWVSMPTDAAATLVDWR